MEDASQHPECQNSQVLSFPALLMGSGTGETLEPVDIWFLKFLV